MTADQHADALIMANAAAAKAVIDMQADAPLGALGGELIADVAKHVVDRRLRFDGVGEP